MKKKCILFFLLNLSLSLNAATYYVDAAKPDDSGNGLSWLTAKQTIGAAQSLAVAGDNVYVKAGTYSFTSSSAGTWAFATVANVNYYGGFNGTESDPSQRATSDLDGNGIIETWELTNPTILNLTLTYNASGLSITTNTATRKFDGFKIIGTHTIGTITDASNAGNVVLLNGYTLFQNNTISGLTVTGTFNSSGGGSDGLVLRMVAPSTVSNCLFESNSISIIGGASQTDVSISPFIRMEQSGGSNRNLFTNSVIRKNQITLDYSAAGLASNYNTRGIYIAMGIATSAAYSAWNAFKNNLLYNNDATYTATYNLGNGGLIYTYNAGVASQDSIINNTLAWNNSSRIGRAITIGVSSPGKYPSHKVLNNVLYKNRNYSSTTYYEQDMACTYAPDNTTAGILIANNITTGGGLTNTTGTNPNIVNNLNDLANSNTDASKGAFFTSMPSTYGSTSSNILTANWMIKTGSYLTGKGIVSSNTTDKAGSKFSTNPAVGAYEYSGYFRSKSSGNWSAIGSWESSTDNSTNWKSAIEVPTSGVNGVTIQSGMLTTVDVNSSAPGITINDGGQLTLNDNTTLAATTLMIQSNETGTGTFVDNNTSGDKISTTATVQQYLPTGRNWYVGVPLNSEVTTMPYTALTAGGATSVSYWDETIGDWVNNYTGNLSNGVGYIAVSSSGLATNNISFTGTLNDGNITVNLTRTVGKTKEGFNLISNPYPSYLNAMTAINANSANMETTIWYRTKGSSYSFETVNTMSGEGTHGVTGYIPPMQAFWVRATVASTPLTFTNAMRSHANPTGVTTTLLKAKSMIDPTKIRLQVSNGVNTDEALIYTNENAQNDYDIYDSRKLSNDNVSIPEIWTIADSEDLVINGFNQLPENVEIPLGFKTGQANNFTIKATQISNLNEVVTLILKDKLLNKETELTEGSEVNFTSDVVNTTNRFSLILKVIGSVTDFDPKMESGNSWSVYPNGDRQIVISGVKTGSVISIYNSTGQKITEKKMQSGIQTLYGKYPSGVYMVAVNNQIKKVVVK